MVSKQVKIVNVKGLHARAAAKVAQICQDVKATVWIQTGVKKVNARSILELLSLGAGCGVEITVAAEGDDEALALDKITTLVESRFEEAV